MGEIRLINFDVEKAAREIHSIILHEDKTFILPPMEPIYEQYYDGKCHWFIFIYVLYSNDIVYIHIWKAIRTANAGGNYATRGALGMAERENFPEGNFSPMLRLRQQVAPRGNVIVSAKRVNRVGILHAIFYFSIL